MRCLVANAFLYALVVIIFAMSIHMAMFYLTMIIWVPMVILGLLLTWWMMTCKEWYHEAVKLEHGGQIPPEKKM